MNPTTKQSHVYILQPGSSNEVKIGFSASIGKRWRTLQTAQPKRLKVLAMVNGDRTVESLLHRIFAKFQIPDAGTEWFALPWEVIRAIQTPVKRLDRPSDMYLLPSGEGELVPSPKAQMMSVGDMRLLPQIRESDEVTEWVVSEESEDNKLILVSKDGSMMREVEREQKNGQIVETVFETYLLEADGKAEWKYRQPIEMRYLPSPAAAQSQLASTQAQLEAAETENKPALESVHGVPSVLMHSRDLLQLRGYGTYVLCGIILIIGIGIISSLFPGSSVQKDTPVIAHPSPSASVAAVTKQTPNPTPTATPEPTPYAIPIAILERQMRQLEKKWEALGNQEVDLSVKETELEMKLEEVKGRIKEVAAEKDAAARQYKILEEMIAERKQ